MRVSVSPEQAEVLIAALNRFSSYIPLDPKSQREQEVARKFRDRLIKTVKEAETENG